MKDAIAIGMLGRALPGVNGETRGSVVDNDLVIGDTNAEVIMAVMRDARGASTTRS
jgi:hypothetical protein